MSFMNFLFGEGSKTKTKPIYNPEQRGFLDDILKNIQSPVACGVQNLQNILGNDQQSKDTFQAPARRDFNQQTLPTIAERFTGAFGEGSQRSSAFGQSLGTAGRELEENLSSQRMSMQSDALSQLLQLISPATSPRNYEYTTNRQPGFLENASIAAAQGLGAALGKAI